MADACAVSFAVREVGTVLHRAGLARGVLASMLSVSGTPRRLPVIETRHIRVKRPNGRT